MTRRLWPSCRLGTILIFQAELHNYFQYQLMGEKMYKKLAMAVAISLVHISCHAADVSGAFAKCASTKNDKSRLACYDKIRDDIYGRNTANPKQAARTYQQISLIDLKVDIKEMVGMKIEVSGVLQMLGELIYLKSEPMDMTPLLVNVANVSREERKALLQRCSTLCNGKVSGTVGSDEIFGPLLYAERLVIN